MRDADKAAVEVTERIKHAAAMAHQATLLHSRALDPSVQESGRIAAIAKLNEIQEDLKLALSLLEGS